MQFWTLRGFLGGASGKKQKQKQTHLPMQETQETWVRKVLWRKWQPLQYSCLTNPMDSGAWHVTVRGVTKVGHD